MKRFFVVLGSLLMLPAFAEVAPVYYDEFVEYSDDVIDAIEDDSDVAAMPSESQQRVATRTGSNRSTSRAISSATTNAGRSDSATRATAASIRDGQRVANRTTVSRTAKPVATSRSGNVQRTSTARPTVSSRSSNSANRATTARVSTTSNVMPVPVIKTNANNTVKYLAGDNSKPLYNSTDPSRVGIANRRATFRSAGTTTTPVVTESDVSTTTNNLDAIAELTEYCKAQYAACMDNYCNVLDDNQGRCSCSKNLKNYQKVEEALATATENFQDTVQKIKYIGLTGDQVASLFAETEAELEMKSSSDSSQLKNSLDSIKRKIIDASSASASSTATTMSFDLSGLLDFDLASGFDLGSFLNTNTSGSSNVSNQRGEQLYKTASARCKTSVLNSCTAQGIEANIITNSYDLEIDKQCIAYERSLNDANDEMRNNVRNASTILQQARLMLAQNRNSYDLRSCVAAIDSCMQDEYVCGDDYELCLDPTGKYLASGAIVRGGTPGVSGGTPKNSTALTSGTNGNLDTWTSEGMYELYATWDYDGDNSAKLNAWGGGKSENLGGYVDAKLTDWANGSNYTKTAATNDIATYLLQKIGYIDKDDKVHGMCASAMKQCQDYAFTVKSSTNKNYKPDNEVVRQYLLSALTKIKLQQDSIISDYAEDCRSDVSSCLSTNGYDETNTSTTASVSAVNACRADIVTCMSVSGYKPKDGTALTLRSMTDWVASMLTVCPANYYLIDDGTNGNVAVKCQACPVFRKGGAANGKICQTESAGGQVTRCTCPDTYSDQTNSVTGELTGCVAENGDLYKASSTDLSAL